MTAPASEEPTVSDDVLLETILAKRGPCYYNQVALALGWPAGRLDAACCALAERLKNAGVYRLVRDAYHLSIEAAFNSAAQRAVLQLDTASYARQPLSVDEAQRLLTLVHRYLAGVPNYRPKVYTYDAQERAMVAGGLIHAEPDGNVEVYFRTHPVAHPDVLFALGLIASPVADGADDDAARAVNRP